MAERNKKKMLAKAIAIASEAFKDVLDRGGEPYILHCLKVMKAMPKDDYDLRVIAVLHDLIEDTDWTYDLLEKEGFSARVIDGLRVLTHHPDVTYEDYIENISHYPDFKKVKMADLRHNSDIMRLKGVRDKDMERIAKYHKSYYLLKNGTE